MGPSALPPAPATPAAEHGRRPALAALPLIGRDDALAAIAARLESPGVHGIRILGPRGVGKTAVWRGAIGLAAAAGAHVLQARPRRHEQALAGLALIDLLGGADSGHDALTADGFLAALTELSAHARVVIAIDGVGELDELSAGVLGAALARAPAEAPITLLLTGDGPPAARDEHRLVLPALAEDAIGDLVCRCAGDLAPWTRRAIVRASEGLPRVAAEIAAAALEDPRSPSAWLPACPPSLAETAAAAVADLSPATRRTLEPLTLVGAVPSARLAMILGDPAGVDARSGAGAEHLTRAGDSVSITSGWLRFSLYQALAPERRRELHAAIAAAADDPIEQTVHAASAAPRPDERLAAQAERVAALAREREHRVRLLWLAAELAPERDSPDARRRRAKLGAELAEAGAVEPARVRLDVALTAEPRGSLHALVAIARARLGDLPRAQRRRLLESAIVNGGDVTALRVRALAQLSDELALAAGDSASAQGLAQAAVALAALQPDPELRALAAAAHGSIELLRGESVASVQSPPAAGPELDPAPRLELEPAQRLELELVRARDRLWLGDREAAVRLRAVADQARADGSVPLQARALTLLAAAQLQRGRWDAAEGHARAAVALEPGATVTRTRRGALAVLWLVLGHRGVTVDEGAGFEPLADADLDEEHVILERWATGLGELAAGRPASSAIAMTEALERLRAMGVRLTTAFPLVPDAVEALLGAGRDDEAATLARDAGQRVRSDGASRREQIAAQRCSALVALRHDPRAAATGLAATAAALDELGDRFDGARSRLALARALRRLGQRRRVAAELERAERAFAALGAPAWLDRCRDERELNGAPAGDDSELTRAEMRVASLVAGGRTNRRVAAELFVSEATVESHLARIYRKLDIRSRTQLTHQVLAGAVRGVTPSAIAPDDPLLR